MRDVDDMLADVKFPPFDLALEGTGSFGRGSRQSVWAGVHPSPSLLTLQQKVETACRRAGVSVEARRFTPHVTVGYLRHASDADVSAWRAAHNLFSTPRFDVDAFSLFLSTPTRNGAVYESLADYPLSSSR